MAESFRVKAAKVINEIKGPNLGITHIKYLCDVLQLCKSIDKTFKWPVPQKTMVEKWGVTDWCSYIDLTWEEHGKAKIKKPGSGRLPF